MAVKRLNLEGVGEVLVYKRRGVRSMRLTVQSDGSVRVTIPPFVPYQAAATFVLSKRDWLQTHQQPKLALLENAQPIGKTHTLRFVTSFSSPKPTSRLTDSDVTVLHPATMSSEALAVQTVARTGAIRALRREAEDCLPQRVADIAARTGYVYTSVIVKKLKGRWGSCDQDHNIVLNLFLMQLPWELIDYVILHELVHTEHLHHGEAFWTAFLSHNSQAKQLRKQMRQYQPQVMASSVT